MELKSQEVLRVLRDKGVEWLRHANSVRTVCMFLRQGHLLARGVAHERGLDQTIQQSDAQDRALGVWYDLFFDAADIHRQYNKRNNYGPVLLEFDLILLEQDWLPFVWVAKSNPMYWEVDTPSDERWFTSINELEAGYNPDEPGHHIVLRNVAGTVRLTPYLHQVVLDKTLRFPYGSPHTNYSELAGNELIAAAKEGGINIPDVQWMYRKHAQGCRCSEQYRVMRLNVLRKFFVDENSTI